MNFYKNLAGKQDTIPIVDLCFSSVNDSKPDRARQVMFSNILMGLGVTKKRALVC